MKYKFIQAHSDEHTVVKMCKVLGVSTSGFYKWFENENIDRHSVKEAYRTDETAKRVR